MERHGRNSFPAQLNHTFTKTYWEWIIQGVRCTPCISGEDVPD